MIKLINELSKCISVDPDIIPKKRRTVLVFFWTLFVIEDNGLNFQYAWWYTNNSAFIDFLFHLTVFKLVMAIFGTFALWFK